MLLYELPYPRAMTVDISQSKNTLRQFLDKNNIGVLATASLEAVPYAATIYVTYDQDLNLYFVTKRDTRKSRNLQKNNQAAIAIYDAKEQATLQAEGAAMEVTSAEKMQWVFNDIWRIATQTSPTSAPPQTQLHAGDYIVYQLMTPSLRLASFVHKDPSDYDNIFQTIPTQPSAQFNGFDEHTN